jgi:hypothetical protein
LPFLLCFLQYYSMVLISLESPVSCASIDIWNIF